MVSPLRNIFYPVSPALKKTAKHLGFATYGTGAVIGFIEGIKFAKTNILTEEPGILPRVFNKIAPISFFTLTGTILAPFIVSIKIHDLYQETLSKQQK